MGARSSLGQKFRIPEFLLTKYNQSDEDIRRLKIRYYQLLYGYSILFKYFPQKKEFL